MSHCVDVLLWWPRAYIWSNIWAVLEQKDESWKKTRLSDRISLTNINSYLQISPHLFCLFTLSLRVISFCFKPLFQWSLSWLKCVEIITRHFMSYLIISQAENISISPAQCYTRDEHHSWNMETTWSLSLKCDRSVFNVSRDEAKMLKREETDGWSVWKRR